ncbi:MAG: hypothetical protein L0177_20635 [Chloroflexi bacterium]|nr:hypothetical protein [Chloroflexota bacterium]
MQRQPRNQSRLFLETTIQIDKVIGAQARRDAINLNLRGRRLCTSGHVLGEYNRALIRSAIIFRDLLRTSPDVGEALKRLPTYIGRHYSRIVRLLATLGIDDDKQLTLERLENFVEFQAHIYFWRDIDEDGLSDEVGCVLKDWRPTRESDGRYDVTGLACRKDDPPPCQVARFIEQNGTALEKFSRSASGHRRRNVNRAAKAFDRILDGSDTPYGERANCYAISDTLIVLEAPNDAEIYSTDGDVHAICEILGKPVHVEVKPTLHP